MAGPQGPIGQQGPRGEKGDPGSAAGSGSFYKPRYWVSCAAALDVVSVVNGVEMSVADGIKETLLEYTLTLYSDGDVDVSCSAGIGTEQSGAGAHYYPRVTQGADTAGCTASADYAPGTGRAAGFWDFMIQSGPQAVYTDADNPFGLDMHVYRFAENDCNSYLLSDDAGWSAVTLSDVF